MGMGKWVIPQRVRDAVANSWAHHMTEAMKLSRLAMAKDSGIDEGQVSDFPPSNTTVQTNSSLAPLLTAGATAGGMLAAGAGGAMLASQLLSPSQPAATPPSPAPAAARVQLYYDDPVKGLVPIGGAADPRGAVLTPKVQQ